MAKLSQGILGPFSGKVGTVVGYQWRGRPCLRSYRCHIAYPNTAPQQSERTWFVAMVRFAAQARQALLLGFGAQAAEAQMTEGNFFVKHNKQNFSVVNNTVEINYSTISLAAGSAAQVDFMAPQVDDDGTLSIGFAKNSRFTRASPEDRVYLFAYCPDAEAGMLAAPTARRTKQLRTSLPDSWRGHEVHLWGFVVDREGRPSNSSYIGSTLPGNAIKPEVEQNQQITLEHNSFHTSEELLDSPTPKPFRASGPPA